MCAANARSTRQKKIHSQPSLQKIQIPDPSDAGKVNEFLYRGSQPNENGIEELHKLGVTLIVDLRGEFKGTREKERSEAEKFGIRLISIPVKRLVSAS